MVSLSEFTGDSAVRKSIEKKRLKAQEKLDKLNAERVMPLIKEIADYDRVLKVMNDISAENAHAAASELETVAGGAGGTVTNETGAAGEEVAA